MRFKIIGVIALLVGAYFALEGALLAMKGIDTTLKAQVYPLVAIFLALVVRVLQAEKHHRDRLKQQATEPSKEAQAERTAHAIV